MKRFLLPIVAASLLTGCANDNLGDISTELSHSSKIRNWSDDAIAGRLLVALADGATEFTVEGLSLEVEPLFPGTKSDKMSRWQLVEFDKSLNLRDVAERIAECSSVEFVEVDIPIKRIKSESMPMPTTSLSKKGDTLILYTLSLCDSILKLFRMGLSLLTVMALFIMAAVSATLMKRRERRSRLPPGAGWK